MLENILQNSFQEFCKINKFEYNPKQVEIIKQLINFLNDKKNIFNLFSKKKINYCFYLSGDVGAGKTMLMNFIYDQLNRKKLRIHFNEFMINFHDYRHEKKNKNSIKDFVRNLKKKY